VLDGWGPDGLATTGGVRLVDDVVKWFADTTSLSDESGSGTPTLKEARGLLTVLTGTLGPAHSQPPTVHRSHDPWVFQVSSHFFPRLGTVS
jgi:hypothetical protein